MIDNICQIPKNKIKILNRKLATLVTTKSLQRISSVEEFFGRHQTEIESRRKAKWIRLRPDESYKQELRDIAERCDFHIDLVKKELLEGWDETWKELNKKRFSAKQKDFFRKLKVLTKYSNFEKRDGSIINKIDVDGEIVTNADEVNKLLKETMQELGGDEKHSSFRPRITFPHLEPLTVTEVQKLAANISRAKALANDMVEDSSLFEAIESSGQIAHLFTRLWDSNVTNSPELQRCLTGRLIPLNKVHPKIPSRTQMRPIIGLSPVLKLLESRFKNKLDDYMMSRMNVSQTGFVRNCGTHVNIVRILKQCLAKKQRKRRGPKGAILFIDFKSAYNNVNIEQLLSLLRDRQILDENEIEFLRVLYTKTYISVGAEKVNIFKGVMQGSLISPALFNIFLDPLIQELSHELGVENVLAYADDLAMIVTSFHQLDLAIKKISNWSSKTGVPINFDKSAILNIKKRINSPRLVDCETYKGYPIRDKYKYLGVWLDETLDPVTNVREQTRKIDYLTRRLQVIPKRCVSPKLMINLWTLIIRPIFDYGVCFAHLLENSKIKWYITQIKKSFKRVMGIRVSTSDKDVKKLMGYDPAMFAAHQVRNAEVRWQERKTRTTVPAENSNEFRIAGSSILLSWPLLKINNMLFNKCQKHDCLNTPQHLKDVHGIQRIPSIEAVMDQGKEIDKRLKSTKRKGRILGTIQEITDEHLKIFELCCTELIKHTN
jgi:hypothetical protein